ncbi:unnamed protein product [Spodoptera littoralis]|uniref:Uncharacterized protein n=1 Tax=Spodoptera littoralis TaxID=7109 RepID=A0A9P0IHW4_SPOLI|nr:unnamed protein product [Spodoptera littoralis]CAH1647867.1 unnamed protein product [Spodoptera littoralis]
MSWRYRSDTTASKKIGVKQRLYFIRSFQVINNVFNYFFRIFYFFFFIKHCPTLGVFSCVVGA